MLYISFQNNILAQEHEHAKEETEITSHHDNVAPSEDAHAEETSHENNYSPLFFLIMALVIGAGTRHFLKKSPLPFTVSLLIIGLLLGVLSRLGYFGEWNILSLKLDASFISEAVNWASHIDPHLILYIFLPTLIFEAAFAMDVHTFKKTSTNAFILAVPDGKSVV